MHAKLKKIGLVLAAVIAVAGFSALPSDANAAHWHGGWRGGHWHGGGGWGYYGAGVAAGAIIGGLLASRYYYGPGYYYYERPEVDDDAVGYCMQRFRSYDPRSGTYLGYDGYRHPCP
jgi:hypothetical protein